MDSNDIKQISEVIDNVTDIAKQPIQNLTNKPTESIGEGLSNIFNLIFAPFKAANIYTEHKLNKFKIELENNMNQIPNNKKVKPPLNVVGPVLEAAKFHIDNDEIRSMFAKLISSSMNVDKCDTVHPAFVEIIKQLRPLDAQIFVLLQKGEKVQAVANIIRKKIDNNSRLGYDVIIHNFVPIDIINNNNFKLIESSFDNLLRLKLIEINYTLSLTNNDMYKSIEQHYFYKLLKKTMSDSYPEYKVEYMPGVLTITSFGDDFAKVCL